MCVRLQQQLLIMLLVPYSLRTICNYNFIQTTQLFVRIPVAADGGLFTQPLVGEYGEAEVAGVDRSAAQWCVAADVRNVQNMSLMFRIVLSMGFHLVVHILWLVCVRAPTIAASRGRRDGVRPRRLRRTFRSATVRLRPPLAEVGKGVDPRPHACSWSFTRSDASRDPVCSMSAIYQISRCR